MGSRQKHWGVVVKPGETLKCDPGELYCVISQIALQAGKGNENVEVFVKVDGNILLMATLSVIRHPQYVTELIFEKQFELLHTSKTSNVSFMGYKFSDDDKSKEDKIGSEKLAASRRAIVQSFKPKVTFVKTKCPGKLNVAGCSDDDEIAKGKNSPEETPLNTPLEKKAKMRRAFTAKTTASVTGKERGHVHVATPCPSKQLKRSPFTISPGYVCKSCSKSFYSLAALEIHHKLKKHGSDK
ncbi:hypothetical protein QOZ80_1BG0093850 [Eleusine coracana subsp. coracana]|nr:hypothetical protein QOZ80_1BG0093850 [Eleusine coracana subsp. coracana]